MTDKEKRFHKMFRAVSKHIARNFGVLAPRTPLAEQALRDHQVDVFGYGPESKRARLHIKRIQARRVER
jgi:hypothetical protein